MALLPGPIEDEIWELAGIFAESHNPAAAWLAFALAREHGFSVPANVDAEITRFAQAVIAPLADKEGSITARTITEAWGIDRGRKPGMELRGARRDLGIYFEYWDLRRTVSRRTPTGSEVIEGLSRSGAIAKLVERHNKSPKTIEGVVDDFASA
jgi:hypothetical protein